ncbi:MAG: cell wall metabolism sensor histidine kinase WalK [Clostridiales bacterium]|nr:cell wall metabolism sensor histidine kinase WalK [Clostridiales bacterium]
MGKSAVSFSANEENTRYIIATKAGEVVDSNDTIIVDGIGAISNALLQSDNFVQSMTGEAKNRQILETYLNKDFFDYARPEGDYILYFRYYKDDWSGMVNSFNSIILTSLAIGLAIAFVLGYVFARTITAPIGTLMNKAVNIAAGDFEKLPEVRSDDEIGKLTAAFNNMAGSLKNTLTEISSEKNKIETIINYMTDGVIAFNLKGEVIHSNPTSRRILGSGVANIENDSIEASSSAEADTSTETYASDEADTSTEASDLIDAAASTAATSQNSAADSIFDEYCRKLYGEFSINDVLYLDAYNTKECDLTVGNRQIKVYFAVFTGDNYKAEGVIAVLHDVTEQQRLEKMRKDFVANVSHELRTPLTSIKSYAETLLEGGVDNKEDSDRFLNVINNEADRMTRLVRDLLQLSRLDNQQLQWYMEEISFVQLIRDTVDKMEMEAMAKNQKLRSYVLGEVPDIEADYGRLEQVVINILSKAIKYTPEGGEITVYIGRTTNEVYMKVADTGIGIPEEDLPRIFERFYRVDKARSREMGGTGLGMAIAKEIVEAHSGTISLESEIGKGTEVTVRLPVRKA